MYHAPISFAADLFLVSGNGNYWITKADGADAAINEVYAKVNFGADFGTVNAMVGVIKKLKDLRFCAGINVACLPVGLRVDVLGQYCKEDFQRIRVEADVSGNAGSIGYEVFVAGGANLVDAPYTSSTSWGGVAADAEFSGVDTWHVAGTRDKSTFCGVYSKSFIPNGTTWWILKLKILTFLLMILQ